jgi:hypothetical protein
MKVDFKSFLESICIPESKSIGVQGSRHNLLLY